MRKNDIFAVALVSLLIIFSCLPLFKNIHNVNLHWDWQQMLSYYMADRQSLLEFGQLPLRTFYFGGGYPLIANPQDGFLNPFFIPVLVFGEIIGMKINILLAFLIGAGGMYYLTRYVLNYHYLGAVFTTLLFCLGGHLHRLLVRGQDYISIFWFFLPLIFAFFIKTKSDRKFIFFTVFALTLLATQAGPYFSPVILLIFLFSILNISNYENKNFIIDTFYLKTFFLIIFLVFLLGAVKILPMLELLKQNPRITEGYNPLWASLPSGIYKAFFLRQKTLPFAGQHWTYFYIGYLPFFCFLASCLAYWKKAWRFLVLFLIFGFLSFSAGSKFDLFGLLRHLPFFHSIESPVRYFVPVVIFLFSLVAGLIFSLCEKIRLKSVLVFSSAAIILVTADLMVINGTRETSFPVSVIEKIEKKDFFQVVNTKMGNKVSPLVPRSVFLRRSWEWTLPSQYDLMLQNIGKINWYGNIHLGESTTPRFFIDWNGIESPDPKNFSWIANENYPGEVYFLNNPVSTAEFKFFSPNKIIIETDVAGPDILIINQNFDKYWRSDFVKLINYNGLLALEMKEKGFYRVKLVYVPLFFYLGLLISLTTFLILTALIFKKK